MLKALMEKLLWIIGMIVIFVFFVQYLDYSQQKTIESNKQFQAELKDMSIPPILSEIQRRPHWTIKHWISADKMQGDCQTANEYMDENILEKTVTRRGRTRTTSIFDYLHSCKTASKRAEEQVSPQARKWCHYRKTDPRLETLCSEWENNGQSYLLKIQRDYSLTEARFKKITNGYYNDRLNNFKRSWSSCFPGIESNLYESPYDLLQRKHLSLSLNRLG